MTDLWIRIDYNMYSMSSFSQIFLKDHGDDTMSLCATLKYSHEEIVIQDFKDVENAVDAFENLVEAKFCHKPILDLTIPESEENISFR